jgi:hypothetical protein
MSSMVIVCSACNKQLTVPPQVMGKKVKCPLCSEIFTAPAPVSPAVEEPPPPPPPLPILSLDDPNLDKITSQPPLPSPLPPLPPPPSLAPLTPEWASPVDAPPPVRRSRYEDDRDDYGRARDRSWRGRYEDDDEDFEQRRWRRRGRSDMEEAESAVIGPSICLIVIGALYTFAALCFLLIAVFAGTDRGGRIVLLILTMVGISWGGLMLLGGIMMKTLRSYGMSMTASIMLLIPITVYGCIIHLALGIWCVVVLNRIEVRRAFRWKAEQ